MFDGREYPAHPGFLRWIESGRPARPTGAIRWNRLTAIMLIVNHHGLQLVQPLFLWLHGHDENFSMRNLTVPASSPTVILYPFAMLMLVKQFGQFLVQMFFWLGRRGRSRLIC